MSSSVSEEKDDERKKVLIKGRGTPAEEREEERANEGVDVMSDHQKDEIRD